MFSTKERRRADIPVGSRRNRSTEAESRRIQGSLVGAGATPNDDHSDRAGASPEEQPWDDMVFEHRNREYGAYPLRKAYSHNVVIGLAITILVMLLVISSPWLSKLLKDQEVPKAPPRKLVYSELSLPPPIDKSKPVPARFVLPRLKKVIKFVPPVVVKETVADVTPTLDEIKADDIGANASDAAGTVEFDEPVEEVVEEGDGEIFVVVDQQPEFEGGYEAMMAFIKQNLQYPTNARRMRIEGTVHVSFVVSKTGAISDVRVLRGIMSSCDQEAIRVVQMMPPWKPGRQNGRPVSVRYILPLKFRLN